MSVRKFAPPALFIPTLYFIEGMPYILVNSVSVYMFKSFGLSNRFIGLAGILMLPWVLKMLWAPLVDITSSKRQWTVAMQFVLAVCTLATAAAFHLSFMAVFVVLLLFLTAFASATHDIAADGYYLLALDSKQQAFYVGIRSTAYRIAMIAGGGIAAAAGMLERITQDLPFSWSTAYGAIGLVFLGSFMFHRRFLPRPEAAIAPSTAAGVAPFIQAFRTYFQQPKIVVILLFILLYRLGEALLSRMSVPFLLDQRSAGGLGLDTASAALIRDVLGLSGLILGGILGGWLISKYGLKRCIWPMALALNVPDLGYLYLAWAQPDITWVLPIIVIEQFGYGLGFTAFMVFLMTIAEGRFKTSHYALSTGFMALGLMLPGMASGYLQELLGYVNFYVMVLFLTLPGFLLIPFIPLSSQKVSS